jgi:NAD(P)-dependent dehydrogenase (short-subunit alcohol dehydrogenase family)
MTPPAAARTALVTGASRGLGAVVARLLADEGYELIVTARAAAELERSTDRLRARGARITAIAGDVADPAHRARLREAVGARGRLDVLVNNASELGPSPLPPLVELPLPALGRVLEVNVVAPLALVQALVEPLSRARGLVVNITSDAAVGGYPGWGGYGASKAALDLVSRTLANELESRAVAVVAVDPGDLRTAMHQSAYPGADISDRPLPEVTVPFWEWLLHQDHAAVSGGRFRAQADRWEPAR